MRHKEWLGWTNRRHQMRLLWAEFFKQWDVLLCPAAATAAFPQNQKGERWERMMRSTASRSPRPRRCSGPATRACATCLRPSRRSGSRAASLPVGVQIIGPQYGDYTCIAFARLLEREYYAFMPPSGYE